VFGDFISGRIWSLTQNSQGKWVATILANSGANNLADSDRMQLESCIVAQIGTGTVARLHEVGSLNAHYFRQRYNGGNSVFQFARYGLGTDAGREG